MVTGLGTQIVEAGNLRAVYELLIALPSFAVPGLPVCDRPGLHLGFIVPGPGALDGISKCFHDTGGLTPAEVIAWVKDTSAEHFARLDLDFVDLWGRWPTLIDWQNVFCEVSKYTRVSHPHIQGVSGRTRIKQEFRHTPQPIDYRFPPMWGLPPERTATLQRRPAGHTNGTRTTAYGVIGWRWMAYAE